MKTPQEYLAEALREMGVPNLPALISHMPPAVVLSTLSRAIELSVADAAAAPLRLEIGKLYRTRAGEKVFIACKDDSMGYLVGIVAGNRRFTAWGERGRHVNNKSEFDLVAEWSDDQ